MSTNFRRTFHSPINNSASKQLYSFPRANRFEPSRRSECRREFYEIKRGALDKRSTSFGFGNKITLQNKEKVPDPGAYERSGEFGANIIKKRGYSFGKDQNRSLINNPQEVRRFPGPGSYLSPDEKHKVGCGGSFQNLSYTMRGKYEDPLSKHGNQLGPNHYSTHDEMGPKGAFFNSKYSSSGCNKIGHEARFASQRPEAPGPGHYYGNEKLNLNGTGTYFNSKYGTTKANSFGRSQRPSPAKAREAPDPGEYWHFSEFALQNRQWNQAQ